MLFAPTLLTHWLQPLLLCVNYPHWDRSRTLTCFILGSTAVFYLEFTLNPHDVLTASVILAPTRSLYAATNSSPRLL